MFKFLQGNNAKKSKWQIDQDLNRGLALLVLITFSIVGSSWLFYLPVYFDIKIAAQILPLIFLIILFFSVTKIQHVYLNKVAPILAFSLVFCSWSYVVYLNSITGLSSTEVKDVVNAQHLGMSQNAYLIGLCFVTFWLGRYFRYSIYLSMAFIIALISILFIFAKTEVIYLLAQALLLSSSAIFSVVSLSKADFSEAKSTSDSFNKTLQDSISESSLSEVILPSELEQQIIKPELDINTLPLNESSIINDWGLILRELHGELRNTTDVDQLFKRMLTFLHGAMEFDAAAVGMLQDKNIRKIAIYGGDDYLHAKSLNWSNQRIKELFSTREPILSTQSHLSADTNNVTRPIHRLDVPVISNQKVVGLVTLFRDELLFDTHDVMLASSIVFHSMIALRQARLQDEIKRLNNDAAVTKLTLFTREQFVVKVKPIFEKLSTPRECSLFIVEIDNLESVTDVQGRDAGARLFKAVSNVIMSHLNEGDVLGRYGNEGFIVLQDETNLMHAKSIAEKIRLKASQIRLKFQDDVITTTVSIGLTIVSDSDESLSSLMRKADMGLFVAKENGCNTVKVSL
ncbi:MAG: sensor domain-containing diguanylate cyclase [Gammaproteobacteria bacterium]|nr:sensor domain-containing diguanylate cyclase [Gammaproteobacteria bacterium]